MDHGPIWFPTDAEYRQLKERKKRDKLLAKLNEVSANKKVSPRKVVKKKEEEKPVSRFSLDETMLGGESALLTDEHWDDILGAVTPDLSPIEMSADNNILGLYDTSEPDIKYGDLFKSEIAMFSQVLKRMNEQSIWVNSRIKAMSKGKGSSGAVGKSFSDLVSASGTLNNSVTQAIKSIADLKLKQVELSMKAAKEDADKGMSVDETADNFYSMIMGNRKEYIQRATGSGYEEDTSDGSIPFTPASDNRAVEYPSGPTPESFYGYGNSDSSDDEVSSYIRHEARNVDVCVLRYTDGNIRFAAIADDGLEIDDYELPDDDLLESMTIQPMSNYAYDKTGRKFRIIDVETDGVDLSDIDDDDYQYSDPSDYR